MNWLVISLIAGFFTSATAPIPIERARNAFAEARLASDEDGGRMWGRSLYGPMIFVDPQSRFAVANQADGGGVLAAQNGVFAGTLPKEVIIANTATDWSGVHWTMVMWGAVAERPASQRALLLHECFHRIQDDLGLPASVVNNPHIDTLEGRYWFLLELRALAKALRNEDRPAAISDALAFRAKRRSLFPEAAANERTLENNEALAEYTGFALRGTSDGESRLSFSRRLDNLDRTQTFMRGFAYLTGPAYGLLIDAYAPGWTRNYKVTDDLAQTLAAAAKVALPDADARAAAYDGAKLRSEEELRDREQRELIARYRAQLADGPVIELPLQNGRFGFDPNTVISLASLGNVYPTLTISADWGTVEATKGARLSLDFKTAYVALADREKIKLNPGWELVPGVRSVDLRVAHH
jgi:hypothetical protein